MKTGELRYYEWGSERPGFVSTWTINRDGSVHRLGEMLKEDALACNLKKESPYN
ncbi:MAG: hypothetical protein ACTSQG_00230 [Promethearchaeota archaeon]